MRIASVKPLPIASGCLKYDVTGKSDLRNGYIGRTMGGINKQQTKRRYASSVVVSNP